MADPGEGVAPDGSIRTGAQRSRVPAAFEPVLRDAVRWASRTTGASLYAYGSVANGTARVGASDVDLLALDLPDAGALGDDLSQRYASLCRGVEVSAVKADGLDAETDEAYGNRVFLRHYCVHLVGPDPARGLPAFPADARAARGFNGDVAQYLRRWRERFDAAPDSAGILGVRIARKSLLAVAGLVSVHDGTWTTDRERGATRWGQIDPDLSGDLARLLAWAGGGSRPSREDVEAALGDDGIAPAIVERFRTDVGLWQE